MISGTFKEKNRKLFSNNREATNQLRKVQQTEKNLELIKQKLNDELSKLLSIVSNIK